ncbi:hypothetical protein ACIOKD_05320 [Streptomyces sp. NPDC087844]|uniref:hypothetical protein n=1 Tax=Streptomyces sp. NPDC087844 TaxID=3365805 RepID=UPI003829ACED
MRTPIRAARTQYLPPEEPDDPRAVPALSTVFGSSLSSLEVTVISGGTAIRRAPARAAQAREKPAEGARGAEPGIRSVIPGSGGLSE